jgi:peptidoglycan/xylan/chitin deacetylase (PgdA/CDA1 family)
MRKKKRKMYFVERPLSALKIFFKGTVWRINRQEKAIYLTFDDGPVPEITPAVLDILDKYHVKATFFCVGENVEKHPEVYAEVLRRGHAVGNHTYNHLKGFEHRKSTYLANVKKAATVINSPFFRPPYGRIRPVQLRTLRKQYKVILWDLITRDYNSRLSPDYILQTIRRLTRNGSVIVFHDSVKAQKNLFATLPQAIEFWQGEGYAFKVFEK